MRAIILLILAGMSAVAVAQVYSWRDASGKMHYSDTPPPGVDAKKLHAPGAQTGSSSQTGTAGRSFAEQDLSFRKRKMDADKARAKADQERIAAEDAKRNCEDARMQLNALESGQRMSRVNASGERIPLDDDMRDQEIEKAKKAVQSWCK